VPGTLTTGRMEHEHHLKGKKPLLQMVGVKWNIILMCAGNIGAYVEFAECKTFLDLL
jgi:hypothetical protein